MSKNTTIVLITYNNPKKIRAFCESLYFQKFNGKLVIADASSGRIHRKLANIAKQFNSFDLDLVWVEKNVGDSVSNSMNECYQKGLQCISTDFFLMTCDDDVPNVQAINMFEKYLTKNNFEACVGDIVWESQPTNGGVSKNILHFFQFILPFFRLDALIQTRFGRIKPFELLEKDPVDRIQNYFKKEKRFHPLFVFQRTQFASKIINPKHREIKFPHLSADYFWMISILLQSRIKYIEVPYIFRFYDNTNLSQKNENHPFPSLMEGIASQDWSKDINYFKNALMLLLKSEYPKKYLLDEKCSQIIEAYLKASLKSYFKSKKRRSISERLLFFIFKIYQSRKYYFLLYSFCRHHKEISSRYFIARIRAD